MSLYIRIIALLSLSSSFLLISMEENSLLAQGKKRLSTSAQKREKKRRRNQQLQIAATRSDKAREEYLKNTKPLPPQDALINTVQKPTEEISLIKAQETTPGCATETLQGDDTPQIPTWSAWLVSWIWSNNKQ